MNAETAAAWAAWLAAAITVGSVVVAVRANRHSKDAVAEARRSVAAAESSATEARRSADAADRQADAAEAMIPPAPPKVAWEAARLTQNGYALENVGTETARDVKVSAPGFEPEFVIAAGGAVVGPHGRVSVQVIEVDQTPDLVEFHVTWDGQTEPVAVPIPGW